MRSMKRKLSLFIILIVICTIISDLRIVQAGESGNPSDAREITVVLSPEGAELNHREIFKSVNYETSEVAIDVEVSSGASWKLYKNSECTDEISDKKMINLQAGYNNAYIKVTAESGLTLVYKIVVYRRISNACSITEAIAPVGSALNSSRIDAIISNKISEVTVDVKVSPEASWKLYSDSGCSNEIVDKKMINLVVGQNNAYIKVTAQDGYTNRVYQITIYKEAAVVSNAREVTEVLSPVGAELNGNYIHKIVDYGTTDVMVDVKVSSGASWKLYRDLICTDEITDKKMIDLKIGENHSYIKVTAESGATLVFRVIVNRKSSKDCDITEAIAPVGAVLNSSRIDAIISNKTSEVTVDVKVSPEASWKLYSDSGCSNEIVDKKMINLVAGQNHAYIKVTAQDGFTNRVYQITMYKEAAVVSNAREVTEVISPVGAELSGNYIHKIVDYGTTDVMVDVKVSSGASWKLYRDLLCTDEITDKKMIDLKIGENHSYIKVTAESGATLVFRVIVNRKSSKDCDITEAIAPVGAVLNSSRIDAIISNKTSEVTVDVKVSPEASWKLYSDSGCSNEIVDKKMINLVAGQNHAYIKVTAQDGFTNRVYQITMYKEAAVISDACEVTEVISPVGAELSHRNVNLTVGNETTEVMVEVKVSSGASWKLYRNLECTDEILDKKMNNLTVGVNYSYIKVTAESGATLAYKVVIHRKPSNACDITEATAPVGARMGSSHINAIVSGEISEVTVDVKVSPEASWRLYSDSGCSNEIVDKKMVNLIVGQNHAYIKVIAQNGYTNRVYQITMHKEAAAGSDAREVTEVISPIGAVISGNYIHKIVDYATTEVKVDVKVSSGANWKLYRDLACTDEITDKKMIDLKTRENYSYIKVTAEDGTILVYRVVVNREFSKACDITGVTTPAVTIGDKYIEGRVDYGTTGVTIGVKVSPEASWKLYKNLECTDEISDKKMIDLKLGENIAYIKVTAQYGNEKCYRVSIFRKDPPAPSSTPTPTLTPTTVPVETKKEVRQINVNGATETTTNTVAKVDIVRETTKDKKVDNVVLDHTKTEEVIQKVLNQKQSTVQIVVDEIAEDKADEVAVTINKDSVKTLSDSKVVVEVKTEAVSIQIPKETIKSISELETDLYFRVVPIIDTEQKTEVVQDAITASVVQTAAGSSEVVALGTPMKIETNYQGFKTNIVFTLKDIVIPKEESLRAKFLSSLGVYINHSDGEKEFNRGKIKYDIDGYPVGIEIEISKFSSFTIVSIQNEAPKAKNLTITGKAVVGNKLTVLYNYQDQDMDKEGKTTIQWYRSNSADGTDKRKIKSANKIVYTLTKADVGKYLIAEITPVAKTGIKDGVKILVATRTKVTEPKIVYKAHVKLGVIGSEKYAEKVARLFKQNYKNTKVVVKKEGIYSRVYIDFVDKKAASIACKEMREEQYIINYYFYTIQD